MKNPQYYHTQWLKTKRFFQYIMNKANTPTFDASILHSLKVFARAFKQGNKIKSIHIEKRSKLIYFHRWYNLICRKHQRNYTK